MSNEKPVFTKILFKLSLDAPYIIIPSNCENSDNMMVDLGHLDLENSFDVVGDNVCDIMLFNLNQTKIER